MTEGLKSKDLNAVLLEFAELKARLEDAESTIDAIRGGEVDALIVQGQDGEQVFLLKGADEPYRIFVEQMREGAITLNEHGTILYSNRAFARMVDEPLECVIGTVVYSYFSETFKSLEPSELARQGRVEAVLSKDGVEIPVLLSATPVDIEGPAAYAVTVTDLSDQKKHEEELSKANAELEGFCYSVSHDMRAPLRAMVGHAGMLIADFGAELTEGAKHELERISSSANHLGRLMDDLLTYSRLSRADVVRHEVDLSSMVLRIAKLISESSPVEIRWEIEPDLTAQGGSRLVEMVLNNLLNNAAKFSAKSDPPTVRFGFDNATQAFFVTDNGIGFDMQYVGKLFIPFERLHRLQDYPGTGIGLANVKRIVTRHGGRVWAKGETGVGATFYFTLPNVEEEAPQPAWRTTDKATSDNVDFN